MTTMVHNREDSRVVRVKSFIAARFSELPGNQSGAWLRHANAALIGLLSGQYVAADRDIAQIAKFEPASASVLRQKLAENGLIPSD